MDGIVSPASVSPPPAADDPVIRCLGLPRRFGALAAVDHLDLSVARGEIFALVGPDGAGKTTLIRMLCGALTPTEGTAVVIGADVARDPEAVKARIGYMPQRFSLYGDLSVMENLRLYRSEEHTSELQSRLHLVCRLLLEKKKNCISQTLKSCDSVTL